MKIFKGNGIKFFIGMPQPQQLVMRIEDTDDFVTVSISDEKGVMLQIALTDEMKKELLRVCKDGKKKARK